jgi:hypothetical protein
VQKAPHQRALAGVHVARDHQVQAAAAAGRRARQLGRERRVDVPAGGEGGGGGGVREGAGGAKRPGAKGARGRKLGARRCEAPAPRRGPVLPAGRAGPARAPPPCPCPPTLPPTPPPSAPRLARSGSSWYSASLLRLTPCPCCGCCPCCCCPCCCPCCCGCCCCCCGCCACCCCPCCGPAAPAPLAPAASRRLRPASAPSGGGGAAVAAAAAFCAAAAFVASCACRAAFTVGVRDGASGTPTLRRSAGEGRARVEARRGRRRVLAAGSARLGPRESGGRPRPPPLARRARGGAPDGCDARASSSGEGVLKSNAAAAAAGAAAAAAAAAGAAAAGATG